MIRASAKLSYSAAQAFPRPVTRGAKYSEGRRTGACRHGGVAGLPSGFGVALQGCCKVVAAQVVDNAALSAFCNVQRLQRGFRAYVRTHEGGCGGAGAHDRARLSVATVALLHNEDKIYISIGYRGSNLQRSCNACNDGVVADRPAFLPVLAQAIENGRIIAAAVVCGGSGLGRGAQRAGFGVGAARAAGCWRRWPAGDRAWQIAPGDAVSGPFPGLETWNSETLPLIIEQYQALDAASPQVHKTRGEPTAPAGPFVLPDMPPPSPGTPTPKARPPRPLPARRPAVFWPCAGNHPAKLRNAAVAPGSGRGSGLRVGAGSGQRIRQGRGVSGLAEATP